MTSRLVEDLLLLSLDPARGRLVGDRTRRRAAVAGAAIADLVLRGALRLSGDPGSRHACFRRTGTAVPTEPLLREVLDLADGRRPKDAVAAVGGVTSWRDRAGALRAATLQELADRGVLRREDRTVLWVFPTTRWWVVDRDVVDALRRRVLEAVEAGGVPDSDPDPARTASLVSLLAAAERLHPLVPGLTRREAAQRAETVAAGDWAAPAVRAVVQEVHAVVVSVMTATTAAATAGGGS